MRWTLVLVACLAVGASASTGPLVQQASETGGDQPLCGLWEGALKRALGGGRCAGMWARSGPWDCRQGAGCSAVAQAGQEGEGGLGYCTWGRYEAVLPSPPVLR